MGNSVSTPIVPGRIEFIENIAVETGSFTKDSFFGGDGPARVWFWDNFGDRILPAIPETVPGFRGTLIKTRFPKRIRASEILANLEYPEPFSLAEFAAIICSSIARQPKGEEGTLPTDGSAAVIHMRLGEHVVAGRARWFAGAGVWRLGALAWSSGWRAGGLYVLSRGLDV